MEAVLYLIPVPISGSPAGQVIPAPVRDLLNSLEHFIVEDIRTARRQLRKMGFTGSLDELGFYILNEHTPEADMYQLLLPLENGYCVGLMSEAGLPGVADPGSELISLAHNSGFRVKPLVGPSSIFLALMASGLNGQQFSFRGYLPVKREMRIRELQRLERISSETGETQIFMETPYRNMAVFEDITRHCRASTLLCIAADLTDEGEWIRLRTVAGWKKNRPDIHKHPAIFIMSGRK
jgi:16S rRNA (cytidine1402-2'-O)-methyltransferase